MRFIYNGYLDSRDKSRSLVANILETRSNFTSLSVVSSESVDSAFLNGQSELAVHVVLALLKMLSHRDGLLDEMIEVLGQFRCTAVLLEYSMDLLSSEESDLWNTVLVSKDDTDLTFGESLLGVLDNKLNDITWLQLVVFWHVSHIR